jgi:threonine/homoserine/homoserine lactone efflux protein
MEQGLAVFLASALLISLSGVLSPGPMTAAVIGRGGRSWSTGIYVSLGHGIIEVPLILLLYLGLGGLFETQWVRISVGIVGGIYLLYTGRGLLRPADELDAGKEGKAAPSVLAGVLLSAGNPWFLLWWATIGLGLVMGAAGFGTKGIVLFTAVHWMADLLWYTFLSALSYRGTKALGTGIYRKVSIGCGLFMLFFGGAFILGSLKLLAAG